MRDSSFSVENSHYEPGFHNILFFVAVFHVSGWECSPGPGSYCLKQTLKSKGVDPVTKDLPSPSFISFSAIRRKSPHTVTQAALRLHGIMALAVRDE